MHLPDPFPPSSPDVSPARAAADLAHALASHGITGIYTATGAKFAVISVWQSPDLTIWTNGHSCGALTMASATPGPLSKPKSPPPSPARLRLLTKPAAC